MWTEEERSGWKRGSKSWDVLAVLREWGYCDTVARHGYSIAVLAERDREENG